MIIEIDGYSHQVLLTGKLCTKQKLRQMYLEAKELSSEVTDLPNLFCRIHRFEQITYDKDVKVDFVIDTDTDRIYVPFY
jgi:hypothetical protein